MTRHPEGQTQSSGESTATGCRRPARRRAWRRWTMAMSAGATWALFASVLPSIPATGQELRIAVVDLAAVAEQMPEKKDIEVKVQAEVAALDREIQNRWKDLGRLNQDFKSDEKTLNAKALTDRQEEIIRKEKELSEYYEKRSSEIKRSATDVSGAFSKLIRSALADMANQKGFDLVFDKENGRLLYANDRFDRTGDLLEVLKLGRDAFSSPARSVTNATNPAAPAAGSPKAP